MKSAMIDCDSLQNMDSEEDEIEILGSKMNEMPRMMEEKEEMYA